MLIVDQPKFPTTISTSSKMPPLHQRFHCVVVGVQGTVDVEIGAYLPGRTDFVALTAFGQGLLNSP